MSLLSSFSGPMKYLIYARVSPRGSDFETETTIQMQIDICREYVKEHGGSVLKIMSDEFFSGKNMARPAFREIMAELESGNADWDCLCVYKLSRMSRSLRDGAHIFEQLYRWNKGFVSVTERNLDFSTPTGRAMLGMLQVFNQFEREQTAENTRNKMVSIAQKGLWPVGKPPYGYKRGEKGDNKLHVDPYRSAIVRDIFEMYASDKFATQDIQRKYPDICKQSILNMLRNRAYLGKIIYAGKEYDGQHTPVIDIELFKRVQGKMPVHKNATRPKAQKRNYVLAGMLRCHCGRFMSPASAKSGKHHYYECTDDVNCKNRVPAAKVEDNARERLLAWDRNINFDDEILKAGLEEIESARKSEMERLKPELLLEQNLLSQAKAEQDKLANFMLSQNLTDKTTAIFNTKLEKTITDIERHTGRIEYLKCEIAKYSEDIFKQAERAFQQIANLSDVLKKFPDDLEIFRQALLVNIEKIVALGDGEYKYYFNFDSSSNGQSWLRHLDSNQGPSG